MIPRSQDLLLTYPGHLLHCPVPCDNRPVQTVDCQRSIRQVVDNVGHPLPGFPEFFFRTSVFNGEFDLMLEFYKLCSGITTLLEVVIDTAVHRLDDYFLASPSGEEDERDSCYVLFLKI